ncbi:MAG: ROK family protein [Ktedonobacterales bacterium]
MDLSLDHTGARAPAIGVEIADAGTRITALVEAPSGARTASSRSMAPPAPDDAVEQIAGLVARLATEVGAPVAALGVALNGRVDAERGAVLSLRYGAGWENVALADRLRQATGLPVFLDTITNAAALAEARHGAGAAFRHVLYIRSEQGVTAAYVSAGHIALRGATGGEGQLGHVRVRADGPRCSCGATGHVEPLASAQAIVRNMIGRASCSDDSTAAMLRASAGRAEAMSAAQVARLAAAGEPAAVAVVSDALDALAFALAGALALLDPDVVVVGGPLAQADAWLFEQLRARVSAARQPFVIPPLVAGTLEPRAALLGATLLPVASVLAGAATHGGS